MPPVRPRWDPPPAPSPSESLSPGSCPSTLPLLAKNILNQQEEWEGRGLMLEDVALGPTSSLPPPAPWRAKLWQVGHPHVAAGSSASPSQAALSPSLTLLVVSGGREMAPVGSTALLGKWMGLEPRDGASQTQLQGLVPAPPSETPALHRSGQGLGDGGRCIPASTPIPGI